MTPSPSTGPTEYTRLFRLIMSGAILLSVTAVLLERVYRGDPLKPWMSTLLLVVAFTASVGLFGEKALRAAVDALEDLLNRED